ncbi:MAG TPA: hypothetical protein VK524_08390 [Polyangiaceae bacterium]|nr:hypothetical protein [Polyangiaceae bacterium]
MVRGPVELEALVLSAGLWLCILFALLASALEWLPRPAHDREVWRRRRANALLHALGFACLLGSAVQLFSQAGEASLVSNATSLAQVGSLDLSLGFEADAASVLIALGLLATACVHALRASAPDLRAQNLGVAAALVALFSGNLVVSVAGYLLAACALRAWAENTPQGAPVWTETSACALLCASALLVFWSSQGRFSRDAGYTPDFEPRVAAVTNARALPDAVGAPAALLSFVDWPNATLRLGGRELCAVAYDGTRGGLGSPSRPCRARAASPFVRLAVPAGRHDVRVSPSFATDELVLEAVVLEAGREMRLMSSAGSVDFRVLRTEQRLEGSRFGLARTWLWGSSVSGSIGVLIALSALLKASTCVAVLRRSARPSENAGMSFALLAGSVGLALASPLYKLSFLWFS